MTISLDAIKLYCRIDGDGEDVLLLSLRDAAVEYLVGAGVPEPNEDNPQYQLAVCALVLEYYDHRGLTETGMPSRLPGLENVITQMKLRAQAARAVEEMLG